MDNHENSSNNSPDSSENNEWGESYQNSVPDFNPQQQSQSLGSSTTFKTNREQMFESSINAIKENRDEYYISGQKQWLASNEALHQVSPSRQIVDGFFNAAFEQIEGFRESCNRNPGNYRKFWTVLRQATDAQLQEDKDFTEEHQHALKFQALKEFIEENGKFGDWASYYGGRLVPSQEGYPYPDRQKGEEILKDEGFVNNDEFTELKDEITKKIYQQSQIVWLQEPIFHRRRLVKAIDTYKLDIKMPNTIPYFLKPANNSEDDRIKNIEMMAQYNPHAIELFIYDDYVNRKKINLLDPIDEDRIRDAMIMSNDVDISSESAMSYKEKILDKIRRSRESKEVKDTITQVLHNSDYFPEWIYDYSTYRYGCATQRGYLEEDNNIYFFNPKTILDNNPEVDTKKLKESIYAEGIIRIIGAKSEHKDDAGIQSAANYAIVEYMEIINSLPEPKRTASLNELLKTPEFARDEMVVANAPEGWEKAVKEADRNQRRQARWESKQEKKRLRAEAKKQKKMEKRTLRRQEIEEERYAHRKERERRQKEAQKAQLIDEFPDRLSTGLLDYRLGNDHLYTNFVNPLNPPEGFELTPEKANNLREDSYLAVFDILLSEGYLDPGHKIQAKDRESVVNNYYKAFDYGNHLGELEAWCEARIAELEDNGDNGAARLLGRRYTAWTRNPVVADDFEAYREREIKKPRGNAMFYRNTSASDVKNFLDQSITNRRKTIGKRFDGAGSGSAGGEHQNTQRELLPALVARERINALDQWGDFIRQNVPNADVDEAAMVFDQKYDSLEQCIKHLDGRTYNALAFNYAGKRCMIAECCGVDKNGASSGAMYLWTGDLENRDGWMNAFANSKTTAREDENIKAIAHRLISDAVMARTNDDNLYVVEEEDAMFRLALRYFETGDEEILKNTIENRRRVHASEAPEYARANAIA